MSSVIYYKFRSAREYDVFRFEGASVPVWELKAEIVAAKKLPKTNDYDLIISNAQTNIGKGGRKLTYLLVSFGFFLCRLYG